MTSKILLLAIAFIISGIIFIAAGIYFISSRFLTKLNEASPVKDPETFKKNTFRSKGFGYTSLGLGALTVVWGIITFIAPQAAAIMGLVYLFILMIAVGILIFMFR